MKGCLRLILYLNIVIKKKKFSKILLCLERTILMTGKYQQEQFQNITEAPKEFF